MSFNWNGSSNKLLTTQSNLTNSFSSNNDNKIKEMETKLNLLEKQLNSLSNEISNRKNAEVVHYNVTCNNCGKQNISGVRYMCGNCTNYGYNLCHHCIKYADDIHPTNHFFIRIPNTNLWNQMNKSGF